MAIKLYNTLSRKKEKFEPLRTGAVGMYNCGPTVYNYAHIGNLRAYIFADVLRRTLEYHKLSVKQIVNITDVGHLVSDADEGEDKMEKVARSAGKKAQDIADFYTRAFFEDLKKLNIQKAEMYPKATDHIPEQIALIETLEKKGYTYRTSDGVYFDTAKFSHYGDLARLDIEGQKEGARVEANPEKRNPADFALWKFSAGEKREQEWPSPWGVGFPGWHIECSAMSMAYLGETFDIHTGGIDHIPVHHTNEIAQSEAATGKPFARFWLHSGFVNVEGEKMAKSVGNFVRMATLEERGISPLAYRYWLLTSHYRTTVNFTWDAVTGAETALLKLHETFRTLSEESESTAADPEYLARFLEAIDDDLDTPKAIALLWELVKDPEVKNKKTTLLEFDKIFGIGFSLPKEKLEALHIFVREEISVEDLPPTVQKLLEERAEARAKKNWERSDELRNEIAQMGYQVRDTSEGQKVSA